MAGVVHYLSDNQVDYESSKLLNDTSSARQSFTSMLHSLLLSCYSLQFLVFNPAIGIFTIIFITFILKLLNFLVDS